jgi:hypothetical protein
MRIKMNRSTLKLFNTIQVDIKKDCEISASIDESCIKNGYVLDRSINPNKKLLKVINEVLGLSGEKANAAFHKSWMTIQESSLEILITQQMMNYLSTYGFEAKGIYNDNTIYIPNELLNIPAISKDIPITVVKAMTADEVLDAIIKLASGIALSEDSLQDIMVIVKTNKYDSGFIKEIKNRELMALLNDYYSIVPADPVEFLRYVISKLTDESLLIKNKDLITKIENSNGKFLDLLMIDAPANLASIFFRFKPLFLAMKKISKNKIFFNQLRRKANDLHVPMPQDYLGDITSLIKNNNLDLDELESQLKKANVFRKIRLAYALKYRLDYKKSILYKVRNGTGWATDFEWSSDYDLITQKAFDLVIASVIEDIKANVEGKNFYIPKNVFYALPATEKQFTGNLPTGTYVSVPEDIVVGIHWQNTTRRIDLDLAVIGESGKMGWDAAYKSIGNKVLFSGDMTSAPAPLGATELFYLKKGGQEPRILTVNYYNFSKEDAVDCKILVAHEKPKNFKQNYMVDINNIVASANIKISKKQNIIGLVLSIDGENRIYFCNTSVGNSITSNANAQATHIRKYLIGITKSSIDFRDILIKAGANVCNEIPDDDYIDLSPEALDKSSILNLLLQN